ncbi:enoyl-CoA hydratase-related protein [Reyranella sp.]|uniref:enoyl-CoA hydratase-related protein n=1 Tax=Reyranella sp. TaxID=1929291 RepID=UPI002F92FF15
MMIRVQITDHVARVTMDHPPVNAQNAAFQDEMIHAFDRLSDMGEVRVAVLSGKGRCFCAGVDIKARADQQLS